MDELGFNKIAAAVLATGLGFMFLNEIPHLMMHSETPDVPVYSVGPIEVADPNAVEVELPFPQADWVAAMDAERGARVFKKCQSCHKVEEGGANGTGPGLWNVVGNISGTHAGINYSTAMANAGYAWTYEQLDGFLEKPSAHMKGTKMAFVGLKKPADRAAVIEYLRINDSNPEPRPEPAVLETPEPVVMDEGLDGVVTDETGMAIEAEIVEPTIDPTTPEAQAEDVTPQ
jgi:cytochrome c